MTASPALAAAALAAILSCCSRGPEGGERRIPPPASTPFADAAGFPPPEPAPCLSNDTPKRVDLLVGKVPGPPPSETVSLPPFSRVALPRSGRWQASFASVPDGRRPSGEYPIRSRLYLLPGSPATGLGCGLRLRADPDGRIDLYEFEADG
ncbi:MAG: hypothetical protein OYG32_04875 [Rhodospirillaceae bacterium]|nr:hypothetical protein [Rhodospirillaceae bacterium]